LWQQHQSIQNLFVHRDKGVNHVNGKKQRLSPVSLIQQYMEEGEGAESTRLLSSLANGGATKLDKTTLSLSDTGAANYPANDVVRVEDNKPANHTANYQANEPDIKKDPQIWHPFTENKVVYCYISSWREGLRNASRSLPTPASI